MPDALPHRYHSSTRTWSAATGGLRPRNRPLRQTFVNPVDAKRIAEARYLLVAVFSTIL